MEFGRGITELVPSVIHEIGSSGNSDTEMQEPPAAYANEIEPSPANALSL